MIGLLMKKIIFAIARMNKKASAILLSILSFFFIGGLCMILASAIYMTNGLESPAWALPVLITGFVVLVIIIFIIACTALSSNYVKRNPDKDPHKED